MKTKRREILKKSLAGLFGFGIAVLIQKVPGRISGHEVCGSNCPLRDLCKIGKVGDKKYPECRDCDLAALGK